MRLATVQSATTVRLEGAATDSKVARRPANTRGTSSLQIGMTMAQRASAAIGSVPALLPEMR